MLRVARSVVYMALLTSRRVPLGFFLKQIGAITDCQTLSLVAFEKKVGPRRIPRRKCRDPKQKLCSDTE